MNIRVQLWIVFYLFAAYLPLTAQQLFIQEYPVELYKGSSQNWDITQDTQGIVYVGNTDGVLVYDGLEWRRVEMPAGAYPLTITADDAGHVYIGSISDFGYLEKDNAGEYQYRSLLSLIPAKDQQNMGEINDIKSVGNAVYFSDLEHVYIYEDGAIRVWNGANNGVVVLGGRAYIVHEGNMHLYRDGVFTQVPFVFPAADIQHLNDYSPGKYIIVDKADRIWIVDAATGVRQPFSRELDKHLQGEDINKFTLLSEGRVALLTDTRILILGRNGQLFFTVTNDMLKGNLWLQVLYEDKQHNLWFSTDESIGMIATSSPLAYFSKYNGIQGIIFSQTFHDGHHYVGTDRGVYRRMEKEKFTYMPGTSGTVWNFYSQGDILYIAHETGILEMKNGVSKRILTERHVETLCWIGNRTDRFLMGTYTSGIWLVKKTGNGWQKRRINGFDDEVRYMQIDTTGSIWIGHYSKGLWKLKLNDAMDSIIQKEYYNTSRGLPSGVDNRVYKLNSDKSIVFATANGIYAYNALRNTFEPDKRFSQHLTGATIYSLMETPNGDIYFRGKNIKHKKNEVAGVLKRKSSTEYTMLTAPFHKIIWTDTEPSIYATDDGAWIANHNRVIVFNPHRRTYYHDPLWPYIRKVTAQDSLIYAAGQKARDITLPYEMNSVHFQFNVPYYENVERLEFQYKLQGFDREWSRWTTQHEASFTNLPEGDYTFLLQTRNIYENESRLASFSFHIDPPFYRTVWAYLLYIGVFALLLYVVAIINTKRVKWQNEMLEKEVNEKTKELLAMNEEIMAQNEEISMINEEVNKKNLEIENQTQILKESNTTKDKLFSIVSHDLRGPVHQLREIFSLMDAGHISGEEFLKVLMPDLRERVGYVAALTDNLLHWAKDQMEGIQVKSAAFNLSDVVQENMNLFAAQAGKKNVNLVNTTAPECEVFADKDMIRLVLRNLMSNAVKFTPSQGSIEVSVQADHQYAIVSVHDTGIGLSSEEIDMILRKDYFTRYGTAGEKGSGLGLMLCREFIEKNKGTFMIESIPGAGSRFSFSVPLTSCCLTQIVNSK
ncbi:ATP-binding protein [Ohtaekwangia kribbensis]|uniref:histidine kinase n=1 Tax=Ohtaekwangia kribbensis TaxID=688913 RepID=A0ABW3KBX5_9BACT